MKKFEATIVYKTTERPETNDKLYANEFAD
jgi:hypothetical protein